MSDPVPSFTSEELTTYERESSSAVAGRTPPPTPAGWPEEWTRLAATLEPEEEIVIAGAAQPRANGTA